MIIYLFGKSKQCDICWDYKASKDIRKRICKNCKKYLNKKSK